MEPLVFQPYSRPQIWGGRQLADRLGKSLPAQGSFGESWELSAHPHHVSLVAEGPFQGCTLAELWQRHRHELVASQAKTPQFPLLVKWLDCRELLSVQVHPDDATARRLVGEEQGKTEAWVVMHAEPTARIYAGLKLGVTQADLERRLDQGTVADCLHSFQPRRGDCVFLPAGTVHAVGGGVLMAEVQQTSDATFRLFDWNRMGPDGKPRQLHREQALDSINWNAGPVQPRKPSALNGLPNGIAGESLAECDYFAMDRYRVSQRFASPYAGRMSIWLVLEGQAALVAEGGGYRRDLSLGETVLIPATSPTLTWAPQPGSTATLLAVTIPVCNREDRVQKN